MNSKDQEKIYKLYESSFRDIESVQPSANLLTGLDYDYQHPNNLSAQPWITLNNPALAKRTYTPRSEQEEGESKFKYEEKRSGDVYYLVKVEGGNNVQLVSRKQPVRLIKISLKELVKYFKEI
jgi:hypothetical protein